LKIHVAHWLNPNYTLRLIQFEIISYIHLNLPHFTSAELLADKFSNYFKRKATIIRNKIISDNPNTTYTISMDADIMFNGNML